MEFEYESVASPNVWVAAAWRMVELMFESVANGSEIIVLKQGSTILTIKETVWLAVAC